MLRSLYGSISVPYSFRLLGAFLAPDDPPTAGGGASPTGGGTDPGTAPPPSGGAPSPSPDDPKPATPPTPDPAKPSDPAEPLKLSPAQQKEFDRLLGARLAEARQKEREKADAEAAKAKGEFEKLYNAANAKVEELTPKAEQAERLSGLLHDQIDAETKDWPPEVKKLIPGRGTAESPVNIEDRLAMVNNSRDLAKRLADTKTPPKDNHGDESKVKPTDPNLGAVKFRRPGQAAKK